MPIKTAITWQCSRLLTVAADFIVRQPGGTLTNVSGCRLYDKGA
jgi:hypothetical protein